MLGTRARVLLAAVIVGAAVFLVLRRSQAPGPPPPPATSVQGQESPHGAGIDRAMAAVLAMKTAPPGATPCETAYNAFKASKDVSDTQGVKAVVLRLAPRDEFLARCAQLPPQTQVCLSPPYMWSHHADCQGAKPPPDALTAMVEVLHRTEPTTNENQSVVPELGPAVAASSSAH
jgi:hypothetical protein